MGLKTDGVFTSIQAFALNPGRPRRRLRKNSSRHENRDIIVHLMSLLEPIGRIREDLLYSGVEVTIAST